jgi:hypothetical protein
MVFRAVKAKNCGYATGVTYTDDGHNLDSGASCLFSTTEGSLINTSPDDAGSFRNYGGPMPARLCPRAPSRSRPFS